MCVHDGWFSVVDELVGVPAQEPDGVEAPRREEDAERREEPGVPGQEAVLGRERVGEEAERDQEEPREDEEGRHDRHGLAVPVEDRERLAAPGPVPRNVGEVLRGGGADEEEEEEKADDPRLEGEGRGDHRPARDLQERAAGNGDGEVGPDAEALRPPPRRERVDEREDEAAEEEEERLVRRERREEPRRQPLAGRYDDEPDGDHRQDVEDPREDPGLPDPGLARDERPVGLVDAVDLEVGDLVQGVRGGIQERRAEGAERDGADDGPGEPVLRVRVVDAPEGADGPRDDAEERRQEREGAGEADGGARRHKVGVRS